MVEFESPERILQRSPEGVRELAAGGTWITLADQPTDDSKTALMLARSLLGRATFEQAHVRDAHVDWLAARAIAAKQSGPR